MAAYQIACLPGDGVGVDILDATQIVVSKVSLDVEHIRRTIAWELWHKESLPVPPVPQSREAIIDAGGLIAHTRNRPLQTAETNA